MKARDVMEGVLTSANDSTTRKGGGAKGKGGGLTAAQGVQLANSAVSAFSSGLGLMKEKEVTRREVLKATAELAKGERALETSTLTHVQEMQKLQLDRSRLENEHAVHGDTHALNVDKFKDNVRNRGDVMAMLSRNEITAQDAMGLLAHFKD